MQVSRPKDNENNFVTGLVLERGSLDTSRENHAGLLDHRGLPLDKIKFTLYIYSVNLIGENYGQAHQKETNPKSTGSH